MIATLQADRAKIALLSQDDINDNGDDDDNDSTSDESIVNETTEKALGKESNDKVRGVLSRIGADLSQEGGYRLFSHKRVEREFDVSWIRNVEWLHGFEGSYSVNRVNCS